MNAVAQSAHWFPSTDADGVLWLALNVPGRGANSLSHVVLEELQEVLAQLREAPARGLVIHSTKPGGFIAGADVNEFTTLVRRDEALAAIRRGQGVMNQIAALPFPTLAVIKGHCLGGGLELALACRYRIAVDDPATRLGLPEVKLGIHPGFGGTVRAIERVGSLAALELMLSGRTLGARQAKRAGLVDACVPERQVASAVRHFLAHRPSAPAPSLRERLLRTQPMRAATSAYLARSVRRKVHPRHYPAPFALLDLWRRHGGDAGEMLEHEAHSVAELITGDTARNLIRVFQLQDQLKALGKRGDFAVRHVHVVGGGTMGGDIAAWCALQGFEVTVEDANLQALANTRARADTLFGQRHKDYPTLRTAALDRLQPDPRGLGRRRADVIVEAVFEDEQVKCALFAALERDAKADALLATNTSSIPLERIATALTAPQRLVGLHFFNPVAKMPLVEVVRGAETPDEVMRQAQSFCRQIDKLPLPVRSAPGFLVNRILMPYLLEAFAMKAEGLPIATIDLAAEDFGMPMGPIELADTVGLDVCLHVARVLAEPMQLAVPAGLADLVNAGKLGRKSGEGFYRYARGKPLKANSRHGDFAPIQQRLIGRITAEARRCLKDGIVASADQVDAGVIFGAGFAPYTGGPLHHARGL
ncbi:MAG: 3-hydroxyacyl-CoA dehydrogenase NAD-binding domain-containing protein [Thiotrichales bacterium]